MPEDLINLPNGTNPVTVAIVEQYKPGKALIRVSADSTNTESEVDRAVANAVGAYQKAAQALASGEVVDFAEVRGS